jgi:hypothetical protein
MFGRWVLFIVYFSVATFLAWIFAFAVVHIGSAWMCHDSAQDATRTLLDRLFVCSRASRIFAAVLGPVFAVGVAVLAGPAHKKVCGAVATLLVAPLMWVSLVPSVDHYAELLCSLAAGGFITYALRRSDVLSAA